MVSYLKRCSAGLAEKKNIDFFEFLCMIFPCIQFLLTSDLSTLKRICGPVLMSFGHTLPRQIEGNLSCSPCFERNQALAH